MRIRLAANLLFVAFAWLWLMPSVVAQDVSYRYMPAQVLGRTDHSPSQVAAINQRLAQERQVSRIVTLLSLLPGLYAAGTIIRRRKASPLTLTCAIALLAAVPVIVHLLGSWLINTFG